VGFKFCGASTKDKTLKIQQPKVLKKMKIVGEVLQRRRVRSETETRTPAYLTVELSSILEDSG